MAHSSVVGERDYRPGLYQVDCGFCGMETLWLPLDTARTVLFAHEAGQHEVGRRYQRGRRQRCPDGYCALAGGTG